jgi:hypothetical protein
MNYSSMTLNELIRAAQDSDCDLVKALVSVLDEVAVEVQELSTADKTEPEDKEYRSAFDEQLEYVKKILDLPNEY